MPSLLTGTLRDPESNRGHWGCHIGALRGSGAGGRPRQKRQIEVRLLRGDAVCGVLLKKLAEICLGGGVRHSEDAEGNDAARQTFFRREP